MSTTQGKSGNKNTKKNLKHISNHQGFSPLIGSSQNVKSIKRLKTAPNATYTSSELKSAARWSKKVIAHVYDGRVGVSFRGFHV